MAWIKIFLWISRRKDEKKESLSHSMFSRHLRPWVRSLARQQQRESVEWLQSRSRLTGSKASNIMILSAETGRCGWKLRSLAHEISISQSRFALVRASEKQLEGVDWHCAAAGCGESGGGCYRMTRRLVNVPSFCFAFFFTFSDNIREFEGKKQQKCSSLQKCNRQVNSQTSPAVKRQAQTFKKMSTFEKETSVKKLE